MSIVAYVNPVFVACLGMIGTIVIFACCIVGVITIGMYLLWRGCLDDDLRRQVVFSLLLAVVSFVIFSIGLFGSDIQFGWCLIAAVIVGIGAACKLAKVFHPYLFYPL